MAEIEFKYLERFAFADPAAGKEARKKTRARQALIVAGRDWLNRWFELYSWAGRETATQFRDRVVNTYEEYTPRRLGVEANGMQVLFGALIRDHARKNNGEHVRIIPIYQPTNVEKNFRIRTGLEPVINQGRLFLKDKTSDLAVEIRGFPTAATKDLVDGLETVIRMAPKRADQQESNAEVEKYARYLRSTGCPPNLIAQKIAEFSATNLAKGD